MTKNIIIAVILGIVAGLLLVPDWMGDYLGYVMDFGLCALLFFVGIDLGKSKDVFSQIVIF